MPDNEKHGIEVTHEGYDKFIADWMDCQSVLDGGRAIKAGAERFLPKPEGMSKSAYASYVQRALFYGATGRTVEALTGAVFRREPTVEIQKSFEAELEDVTLSGVSFQSIAQDIFSRVLGVGRHGVLIDWSDSNARPYWSRYDATSITNWQTQRIGGKQVLTQVILHETATTPSDDPFRPAQSEQYRQLFLAAQWPTKADTDGQRVDVQYEYHNVVWQPKVTKDELGRERVEWVVVSDTVPLRRGAAIPFIPFTFFGPGGIDPMPLRPPLIDLVEVNLAHYRVSADHKHALFLTAQPTPWVTGVKDANPEDLKIGSSSAWVLESPDAKVGMLEFSGAGVEAMQADLKDMQGQMSVLGARLLEVPPTTPETASAVRMRHAGDDAVLQKIAMSCGSGLTQVLRQHAWWSGTGEYDVTINVELSREFFAVRMGPQELQALLLAVQAGQLSYATFYRQLQLGGIARPGITEEDEKHAIGADDGAGSGAGGDE